MRTLIGFLVALLLASGPPAFAEDLPPGLAELLREANPKERDTIKNVAKRAYPEKRKAIDDLVDDIKDEEEVRVAKSGFVKGWSGEGSLGGNISSGNTDEWNLSVGLDIKRKGPRCEHWIQASIDLNDVEGQRTDERVDAAYRARFDFEESRWFLFGSLRYDREPFQGTNHRFTESAGGGYELIDGASMAAPPSARPTSRTEPTRACRRPSSPPTSGGRSPTR